MNLPKRIGLFGAMAVLTLTVACQTPYSRKKLALYDAYESNFRSLEKYSPETVKSRALANLTMTGSPKDIHEAAVMVAMQKGPITHVATDVIVAPPFVLALDGNVIHGMLIEELYKRSDDPQRDFIKLSSEDKDQLIKTFLRQIEMQLETAGSNRWPYLSD